MIIFHVTKHAGYAQISVEIHVFMRIVFDLLGFMKLYIWIDRDSQCFVWIYVDLHESLYIFGLKQIKINFVSL